MKLRLTIVLSVCVLTLLGGVITRAQQDVPAQRDELVAETLMWPFVMVMMDKFSDGRPESLIARPRSGGPDQQSCQEHKRAADTDLNRGRERRCVHVAVPDPADRRQLYEHHGDRHNHRQLKLRDEERQRVADSADCRHTTLDDSPGPWVPPTGQ